MGNCPVDITIKENVHMGLNCVAVVANLITYYKPLKPILLVLKHILVKTELNDPYKGGLTSYGLILMIVAFI